MLVPDGLLEQYEMAVDQLIENLGLAPPDVEKPSYVPLSLENIAGFGVGEKTVGGRPTNVLAIQMLVVKKAPSEEVDSYYLAKNIVPKTIGENYVNDVVQVGKPHLLHHVGTQFAMRVPGGAAISGDSRQLGTLGGWLTDRAGTNYYLLTCGHCIATSHEPSPDIGPVLHHGKPIANIVSLLWKDHKQWTIDAAIARSEGPDRVGDFLLSTGEVRGTRKVRNTYHFVKKSGAVTHHTTGGILSLSANLPVLGPSGRVFYRRQLGIHTEPSVGPFASDGDSGSLVLDKDNYVVGLLVAGDPTTPYYIATPIDRVLEAVKEALNVPLRFITYP